MLRIRLYLRRSHADQKRGISIELQRTMCRDAAERIQGAVTGEYIDDDTSAFRDDLSNRPSMRQALADARSYDILLVYNYDRLARDEAVYFDILRTLERAKATARSATESNEPLGRALSGVLAAEYSRVLSNRMRDVRMHEARQGRIVGAVPLGYDRVDGIGVPNAHAPLVRQAGDLYATGEWSVARLATHLGLNRYQLDEMLDNPVYAGYSVCSGQTFPGKHPAIWDADLWARIQAVRRQRRGRATRHAPRHDPLLTGLAVCADCGAPMWHQARDGDRRTYECSTTRNGRETGTPGVVCTRNIVRAESVEDLAIRWIIALADVADLSALASAQLELPAPAKRIDPTDTLRRLARAYADGGLSDAEYERRRTVLLAEPAVEPAAADSRMLRALLADVRPLIEAATNSERRVILRAFVSEVWVGRNTIIAFRPTRLGAPLLGAAHASRAWVLTSGCYGGPGGDRTHDRRFKRPLLYR